MFIKINNTNYFVDTRKKSVHDIYEEIFSRMNKTFISLEEKRHIISEICKQMAENRNV